MTESVLFVIILVTAIQNATAVSNRKTLVFDGAWEEYKVTFDPLKISENKIRQLIAFSPYTGQDIAGFETGRSDTGGILDKDFLAPELERCIDNDPKYSKCGTGDLRDPNFYKNAGVNLQLGQQQLSSLDNMDYPLELTPVVEHLKKPLAFFLWLQKTRYEFYQSWNVEVLKRNYDDDSNPTASCPEVLQQIANDSSRWDKYTLVRFKWFSCMLDSHHTEPYPIGAWKKFLQDYDIREEYIDKGVDD